MDEKSKIDKKNAIKEKIIKDLCLKFFDDIRKDEKEFEKGTDIINAMFDILVVFNRELLLYIFKNFYPPNARKNIMKNYFNVIKDEVNRNCKASFIMPTPGTKQ